MFPDDAFEVVAGSPAQYASTAEARRGFCPSCGTQMTFTSTHLPGFIDVTVGSFDAPESVRPTQHIWDSSCLPWMRLADGLPRHSGSPPRTA
jgi:hypothetical protein